MLNIKLPAKEKVIKEKIELINSIKIIKKVKALTKKIKKEDFHTLAKKATFEMKLWMYLPLRVAKFRLWNKHESFFWILTSFFIFFYLNLFHCDDPICIPF